MADRKTNVADFIGECNAGIMIEKLALALSDAALAQITHGIGSNVLKTNSLNTMSHQWILMTTYLLIKPFRSGLKSSACYSMR